MSRNKMFLGAGANMQSALEKAAETTQLDDRHVGTTIGDGITPPYDPTELASFQELNGTHAVAVGKKAAREVGFGFEIVPHERADNPDEDERKTAKDFWLGRDSIWKIGPQGTPAATPDEVFELARRDWHGVGWLCIELIYGADDALRGLAHVPADEVRVREKDTESESVQSDHGYVQYSDGESVYYAEAGDRHPREDDDGTPTRPPRYVDQNDGQLAESQDAIGNVANELLFVPNPSPLSKYYGIPDWVAAIRTMVADAEAERHNREFFEWDAMGQYFVIVEGGELTDESREDVRNMIKGLRENDGRRVAVLEAEELVDDAFDDTSDVSIRIEQVQQHSDEDMAFGDFRRLNEHEVAKVHEVPPQLIGVMESANRSNSEEAIRDFVTEVVQPRQERFAGRLFRIIHQRILGVTDWTIEFNTKGARNEREEADIAATLIKSAGPAMTVNEVRELAGEEPLDTPMGQMLMSELSRGGTPAGGVGAVLEQAIDERVDEATGDLLDTMVTERRIEAGSRAD